MTLLVKIFLAHLIGDLRAPGERKLTEYILIGTLLSLGIAMLTAMAYMALKTEF